jgi:hypothetical protein
MKRSSECCARDKRSVKRPHTFVELISKNWQDGKFKILAKKYFLEKF